MFYAKIQEETESFTSQVPVDTVIAITVFVDAEKIIA